MRGMDDWYAVDIADTVAVGIHMGINGERAGDVRHGSASLHQ